MGGSRRKPSECVPQAWVSLRPWADRPQTEGNPELIVRNFPESLIVKQSRRLSRAEYDGTERETEMSEAVSTGHVVGGPSEPESPRHHRWSPGWFQTDQGTRAVGVGPGHGVLAGWGPSSGPSGGRRWCVVGRHGRELL